MSMTNYENASVRRATPSDLRAVQQISAEAYIAAYVPIIGVAPKPASEDYRPHIERGGVWILEVVGEPAGVIVLEESPGYLLVYSVAVKPKHQRKGYATALLEFAIQHARAIGTRALRLYTNQRVERNVALYRRCGFIELGKRPHPSRPGEILVDVERTLPANT